MFTDALLHQHALVCGASRGIGRATALAMAAQGAEVTVLARDGDALEALLPDLVEAGAPLARKIAVDLDQTDALMLALSELGDRPINILVNNTGGPPAGPLTTASPEALMAAFRRHVIAAQVLTQALLPGMIAEGYGRIINVLSTSVREPIPNLGVSNTIRGAMASWAKTLSLELPPEVTINNVLPGFTRTERLSQLIRGGAEARQVDPAVVEAELLAQVPIQRWIDPDETAQAIVFLASPLASAIRGINLPVDGGRIRAL